MFISRPKFDLLTLEIELGKKNIQFLSRFQRFSPKKPPRGELREGALRVLLLVLRGAAAAPRCTTRSPSKSLAGETTRSELGSSGETPAKAQQPRLLQQPTRAEVGRHRRERGRGRRDRRRLRASGERRCSGVLAARATGPRGPEKAGFDSRPGPGGCRRTAPASPTTRRRVRPGYAARAPFFPSHSPSHVRSSDTCMCCFCSLKGAAPRVETEPDTASFQVSAARAGESPPKFPKICVSFVPFPSTLYPQPHPYTKGPAGSARLKFSIFFCPFSPLGGAHLRYAS